MLLQATATKQSLFEVLFWSVINGSSFTPPTHTHAASHGTGAVGELAAALFVQNAKCQHFLYPREEQ